MAKRLLDDWLDAYQRFTENSESPMSFHLWGGVSAIAAALQRRVYIKWGHTTIYPNNYIVLVGPSGQSRKGEAINIARSMVENIKVALIGEDNSMEAIIVEMKRAVSSFQDKKNGRLVMQCAISSFIEELSVFTGEQNTRFLAYLTNWYDSRTTWKRTTKNSGTDEITGVCLNILCATAPDWLPYILPREAIGGGFTSRCMFIVERGKSKIIPNPNTIATDERLKAELRRDLEVIHTLSGQFDWEPKALREYEDFYTQQEMETAKGNSAMSDPMFSGYMARRAMHLFKLMMVLSISRSNDLVLLSRDFKRALKMILTAEKRMPQVFAGIGRARYAQETDMVLNFLAGRKSATKAEILSHFFRQLDDFSFEAVMKVLTSMNSVRCIIAPGTRIYEYTGKGEDQSPPPPLLN